MKTRDLLEWARKCGAESNKKEEGPMAGDGESDQASCRSKAQPPTVAPRWLRISEAAVYAGCCRNTIRAMLKRGDLVGEKTKVGGHWRIDKESIDRHLGPSEEKAARILAKFGLVRSPQG